MVLMVLSEDYTPKSTVVESRRIPLSFVAFWGLSGVFPTPPQGIPDGTCREFVKKWRIYPPAAGRAGIRPRHLWLSLVDRVDQSV